MLKIVYCKDGNPISDFKVYEFVDGMIDTYLSFHPSYFPVETSSELCLMVFVLRTIEDKIPLNEIEFYFENEKIEFHPYLGIVDPEDQKLGFFSEVCDKAIKIGYEKMKQAMKNKQ